MIDSAAECEAANVFLGTPDTDGVFVANNYIPVIPCGCLAQHSQNDSYGFNPCAYGSGSTASHIRPVCRVPGADGGGGE